MEEHRMLVIIIIILLILLIFISIKERYVQRIVARFSYKKGGESYFENINYKNETSLYKYYHKQGNIVMLGNSITYRVNWNELLDRNDIINRGINNDITEGFLNRISDIVNVNPKICFIMGGVNDIRRGVAPLIVKTNIKKLIGILQNNKIKPVIFSILYVADTHPDYYKVNAKIKQANELIKETCKNTNTAFIDLNEKLGNNNILRKEYSLDGLHLTGLAYQKWGEVIIEYLDK